jgi:hypothetical protein
MSVLMTKMDDFRIDGRIDWTAYNKAQKDNGEVCCRCGDYIVFASGYMSECYSCKLLKEDKDEVRHERQIRCPHCCARHDIERFSDYFYREGPVSLTCSTCELDFEVEVEVTYSFKSPALVDQGTEDEDELVEEEDDFDVLKDEIPRPKL